MALVAGELGYRCLFLFTVIYLSRVLGPSGFGSISFILAALVYFYTFAGFGLEIVGAQAIARDKSKLKPYVDNIITVRIFIGVLSFVGYLLFVNILPEFRATRTLSILYGISILPYIFLLEWAFQGMERMKYIGISRVIKQAIQLLLLVVLVKNVSAINQVPVIYAISIFASVYWLLLVYKRKFGNIHLKYDFSFGKNILKKSAPVGYSTLMMNVSASLSILMLGFLSTKAEVGYYSAAQKVVLFCLLFSGLYNEAVFPAMSFYFKNSVKELETILNKSMKLLFIFAIPFACGGAAAATGVVRLLYGEKFSAASETLRILSLTIPLAYFNGLLGRGLLACDNRKGYAKVITYTGIATVVFNAALIPVFGMIGAAIATVTCELFMAAWCYRYLTKKLPVNFGVYAVKPLIACAPML
ncbi:MAG: flippase, partial [Candidatus Omnitrophota bacterium]